MKTTSETDWETLALMTDDKIDYSDIPPMPDAFFRRAKAWRCSAQGPMDGRFSESNECFFKGEYLAIKKNALPLDPALCVVT